MTINSTLTDYSVTTTLANGIKVVILHQPDFVISSAAIGVAYGALDFKQCLNKQEISVPAGTAHFLEHKMFEDKSGDLMNQFAELGASVNAFTSYEETIYYFQTTNSELLPALSLLIKLVSSLTIDETAVKKEQGIIIEELLMYLQMPDSQLYFQTLRNMYHHYPLKYDIGGDEASVLAITPASLKTAFDTNYHPSQLTLVISTPILPEKIIAQLNGLTLINPPALKEKPTRFNYAEAPTCALPYTALALPVDNSKVALGIKLLPMNNYLVLELALKFWLKTIFSVMNPAYQTWLDQKLINDYFDYEISCKKDYAYLMFFNEKTNPTTFQAFINEALSQRTIALTDFKQLQKNFYSNARLTFNSTMDLTLSYLRQHLADENLFENLALLTTLSLKELNQLIGQLDLSAQTIVEIK